MYDVNATAIMNAANAAPVPNFQMVWRTAPRPTEEQFAENHRRLWTQKPAEPTEKDTQNDPA